MITILTPTDFTPASQNASQYAAELCKASGAKMILMHIYMLPLPVTEIPYAMITADEFQHSAEQKIKLESDRLFSNLGIEVEWIVRLGMPSDEIKILEEERKIDLIVMGMKGDGGLEKLIGSTTNSVIRKSKAAVLVIPRQTSFTPAQTVAYATDFSYNMNKNLFEPLQWLIRLFNASLKVVYIQKPGKNLSQEAIEGKNRLSATLENSQYTDFILEDNDIEHGIQQFVEQHQVNMLVMVAHKHNMLERLFGTHHTKVMTYKTDIPLLVLKDAD